MPQPADLTPNLREYSFAIFLRFLISSILSNAVLVMVTGGLFFTLDSGFFLLKVIDLPKIIKFEH